MARLRISLRTPACLAGLSAKSAEPSAVHGHHRYGKLFAGSQAQSSFGIDGRKCMISIFSAESTPSNVGTTDTDMCAALDEEVFLFLANQTLANLKTPSICSGAFAA